MPRTEPPERRQFPKSLVSILIIFKYPRTQFAPNQAL